MATTGVINGKNLLVYVGGTAIGMTKSCKINISQSVRDTTTKNSGGWKDGLEGERSWKIDGDGLVAFDATFNFSSLFALITDQTKCSLSFETNVSGDKRYYGSAFLTSLDADAPNEESTSFSFGFEGVGVLTEVAHT